MLKKVFLFITAIIFSIVSVAQPGQDDSMAPKGRVTTSGDDAASSAAQVQLPNEGSLADQPFQESPQIQMSVGIPEAIKEEVSQVENRIPTFDVTDVTMSFSERTRNWSSAIKESSGSSVDRVKALLDQISHYGTKAICVFIRGAMAYGSAHLLMIHSDYQYVPSAAFSYEMVSMAGSAFFGLFNGTFYKLGKKYGFSWFLGTEIIYVLAYTAALHFTEYAFHPEAYAIDRILDIFETMVFGLAVGFFGQTQFDKYIAEKKALNHSIIDSWREKQREYKHSRHLVVQNKAMIMSVLGSVLFNSATLYMSNQTNHPQSVFYAGVTLVGAIAYGFSVKIDRKHRALQARYEAEHAKRRRMTSWIASVKYGSNKTSRTEICSSLFSPAH